MSKRNNPVISDYLLSVNELENLIKKPKSTISSIATDIIIENENIFSFNKTNIDNWCTSNNKTKLSIDGGDKIPHNLMKSIIKNRRILLQDTFKNNLESLKTTVLKPKKYHEYTVNLDHFIQTLLKFEFLGLCIVKIKKYEYPIFCYYCGKDNTIENLSKKANWRILPSSLVDLFHGTYKKSWQDYLQYNEDHYNITNNMEQNNTFKLLDTIKPDQLKLLYKDHNIPKLIDSDKDKNKLTILKYDLRYFTRKYRILLNAQKPKQPKKRKLDEITDKEEDDGGENGESNNKRRKKQQQQKTTGHCAYGFSEGLSLTNEKFPNTIEDWKNKNNIVPTNLDIITMIDVKDFVTNTISKNSTININSGLLPDIIMNAFNPKGVVNNCIRLIGLKNSLTIKNDNNQLSNIEENILDNPANHEDIRNMLYSHLNSIIILSILSKHK